jgi:hypothetical protein
MDLIERYIKRFHPCSPDDIEELTLEEFERCIMGDMLHYVYVILNQDSGLFKIGITNNLKERFRQLKNQSGANLHLLLSLGCERGYDERNKVLESWLHEQYKPKRVVGEWFKLTPRDLVEIRRIGAFIADCEYHPLKTIN